MAAAAAGMVHFRRSAAPTRHLAVGNCGPAEANQEALQAVFAPYGGTVTPGRGHVAFVSLPSAEAAAAACAALQGTTHTSLPGSGPLSFKYAELDDGSETAAPEPPLVAVRSAEECGIPGLTCRPGFVSEAEEAELLREADAQQHWQCLSRRRVLHFGAAFDYEVSRAAAGGGRQGVLQGGGSCCVDRQPWHRVGLLGVQATARQWPAAGLCHTAPAHLAHNTSPARLPQARDVGAPQQPIPPTARRIADRIEPLPGAVAIDQLTVNEYAPGVGIAPHVGECSPPAILAAACCRAAQGDHLVMLAHPQALCVCLLPQQHRVASRTTAEGLSAAPPPHGLPPPCRCRDARRVYWRHRVPVPGRPSGDGVPPGRPCPARALPATTLVGCHGRCDGGWRLLCGCLCMHCCL